MTLKLTVEDVVEPLAELLYDDPSEQRRFLDQDYLQKQADNTTVIQGMEEIQAMIEIAIADSIDCTLEDRFENVLKDVDEQYQKLSDNFSDSDAWLDVDFSDWVDGLDG